MTAKEIIEQLQPLGSEGYRRILLNHGVKDPILGVKIEELKKIQKKVKKDYQLAKELYDTGIYDAMYLAGLIADEMKMTKKDLRHWQKNATSGALCSYTVAWVAAEGPHGWDLAMEWIDSKEPAAVETGWATLSSLVAVKEDKDLNVAAIKKLLQRVEKAIHDQPDRVRYVMNGFVIAAGAYVKALTDAALQTGGTIGKKRKTARC
jgi:3-methyladenine DNA glycosylase AlkD